MTAVVRLLPRHWDGRRLLQFLTGLALIALAFAAPALMAPATEPAEPPVTIITTVDSPAGPGLPVDGPSDRQTPAGTEIDDSPWNGPAGDGTVGRGSIDIDGATGLAAAAPALNPGSATAEGDAAESAHTTTTADTADAAESAGAADAAATTDTHGVAAPASQHVASQHATPLDAGRSVTPLCAEARAAFDSVTQRAYGERGPPRV